MRQRRGSAKNQPGLSRRHILGGFVAAPVLVAMRPSAVGAGVAAAGPVATDPVLSIFRDWQAATKQLDAACRLYGRLEGHLLKTIGTPHVRVGEGRCERRVFSPEEIDLALPRGRDAGRRNRLKAQFADMQAKWNQAALACGLPEAEARREAAFIRMDEVLADLAKIPARSIEGVVASALADLKSLHAPIP